MRVSYALLLIAVILSASTTPYAFSAEYASQSLTVTVYADGLAGIVYGVDVDPTLVRLPLPLFGFTLIDLLVVNENGVPLVTSKSGSIITVDTLGASRLTFTYSTPELTAKMGILWTLNVTSPTNLVVVMPSGSTIVSMSQIPLEVKTVGERTQVMLPPGEDSISYVNSLSGVKDQAETVIQDAETTINTVKSEEVITADADVLLTQAKVALAAGEFLSSEQLAAQAKASALDAELKAQAAVSAIELATTAIQAAKNEDRTSTIAAAEGFLADAQDYYTSGKYVEAKTSADKAYASGSTSQKVVDNTPLIIGGLVVAVAAVAALFLYFRRRKEAPASKAVAPQALPKKSSEGLVNLEAIFRKNPELRVDDKEVLRFLAEHRGEVFANEIRDRFDIPRTSAWRMIRRLIAMGIVEERKIGGQSLICIVKKYREAQG
jgi:uncharacterized membrane protein